MSTTSARLTFDEFLKLPEQEGTHYELDEGELVLEHPPTFLHNRIRGRIARKLSEFVEAQRLGEVIVEMDFRLGLTRSAILTSLLSLPNTCRK